MALKKTEIFKAAPGFNHVAAQRTYDLIMKMDNDEAQIFAAFVAQEMVQDTIEKNLRTVQGHLDKVVSKRMEKVRKATLVAAMKDPEGSREFAQAFSTISKAYNGYDQKRQWKESDYNRDAGSGRFRAKVKSNADASLKINGRQAQAMGIPEHPNKKNMSTAQQAAFQQEYLQLANFLGAVSDSTEGADVNLKIRSASGSTFTVKNNGNKPDEKLWNPAAGERLVGVEAKPTTVNVGGAAFGLSTALGMSGERAIGASAGMNRVDRNMTSFANDWTAEVNPQSSTAGTLNRIAAGSKFASQVAPAGSNVQIAAGLGQFVGNHGADAEKVFGPAARKTAYRYRGMTTTPDSKVVRAHRLATDRSMGSHYSEVERSNEIKRRQEGYQSNTFRNAERAGRRFTEPERQAIMAEAKSKATAEMAPRTQRTVDDKLAGKNVLEQYLQSKEVKPNGDLYNLQLEAGNTPPSQGFIVDKDGKITTQAAGYGDDHYLPFNLKGLKGLKGGEYVRSRSVGGPTSEDIYAGVMSGATGFAVTSRSGTFYVEFQDDLGKRTPDKARRMTRRYEQLLDAVQSEQVDRMSMDPEIRAAIVENVRQGDPGAPRRVLDAEIKRQIEDFKSSPELSDESDKIAMFIAQNRAKAQDGSRDAQDFLADAENLIAEEKEYKYRLNGAGYEAALKSLQEQFPYYLKVNYKPRRDEERLAVARDKGYVEPGRNRPTDAKAGLHGTTINQGRKFSASQADYQRGRGGRLSAVAAAPVAPASSPVRSPAEQAAANLPAAVVEDESTVETTVAANEKRAAVEASLIDLKPRLSNLIKNNEGIQAQKDLLALDDEAFVRALKEDRASMEKLDALITQVKGKITPESHAETFKLINQYQVASGDIGTSHAYNPLVGRKFPEVPYTFEGEAYSDPSRMSAELAARGSGRGIATDKALKDMNDQELSNEVETVRRLINRSDGIDFAQLGYGDFGRILGQDNVVASSPTLAKFRSGGTKAMDEHLENVHRTRALTLGFGGQDNDIVVNNGVAGNEVETRRNNLMSSLSSALKNAEDHDADPVEISRIKRVQDALSQGDMTTMADLDRFQANEAETLAMAMKMMHRDRNK